MNSNDKRQDILRRADGARLWLAVGLMLCSAAGCAVTEKPGLGTQLSLTETESERRYYLYKPVGYDANKQYPLVVALHALKPFDTAERQIREWQSSADKYGMIVVAPVVANANMFAMMANIVNPAMKRDAEVVMDILEEVMDQTPIDPDRIFITGLSSSGPLMYYLANQHPETFAALCARGCWFNSHILDEETARRMAGEGFRVLIHYAEYDNTNIKLDSWESIRWHEEMGFEMEYGVVPQRLRMPEFGHVEGTVPTRAAEFFMRGGRKVK